MGKRARSLKISVLTIFLQQNARFQFLVSLKFEDKLLGAFLEEGEMPPCLLVLQLFAVMLFLNIKENLPCREIFVTRIPKDKLPLNSNKTSCVNLFRQKVKLILQCTSHGETNCLKYCLSTIVPYIVWFQSFDYCLLSLYVYCLNNVIIRITKGGRDPSGFVRLKRLICRILHNYFKHHAIHTFKNTTKGYITKTEKF